MTGAWQTGRLFSPPSMEWIDQGSEVWSLFYEGEVRGGFPSRIFAWYASPATLDRRKPTSDENFPGVVLIHGGEGTAFREWALLWAKRGYAAIAMDHSGRRSDKLIDGKPTPLSDGGPLQGVTERFHSITEESLDNHWPYHAVANTIRAHSLLRSFPEVASHRVSVTGISWGGYVCLMAISLDPRFHAAVAVYGCGFITENPRFLANIEILSEDQVALWTNRYDPSSYLRDCSTPILLINGTNDGFFPLDLTTRTLDLIGSRSKHLAILPDFAHSHEDGWAPSEIDWFIDWEHAGSDRFVEFHEPQIAAREIKMVADNLDRVESAKFFFAPICGKINQAQWQSKDAQLNGNRLSASLDDIVPRWAFFSVTDAAGHTLSSRVFQLGMPS